MQRSVYGVIQFNPSCAFQNAESRLLYRLTCCLCDEDLRAGCPSLSCKLQLLGVACKACSPVLLPIQLAVGLAADVLIYYFFSFLGAKHSKKFPHS